MRLGTKLGFFALAFAMGTTVFWFYLTSKAALPNDRTGFVIAWLIAVSTAVFAYNKGTSLMGGIPPAFAILVSCFLVFTIYISPQEVEEMKVIKVGDNIPRFKALDDRSNAFDSRSLNGHLVLIKFFRAHW